MEGLIYGTAAAIGLLLGSFLNVVIHRGPALWGLAGEDRKARGDFLGPRSYCPACHAPIRRIDLLPLVGFALRRGRCGACDASIALRYPLVEAAGALAALVAVSAYGLTILGALAFTYFLILIALAAIDHETGYLPDALTLPLIAGGIGANVGAGFVTLADALIGVVAGYAVFWTIGALYQRVRSREGLGGGDAKLLAAIGAWCGWQTLAPAVFGASVLALAGVQIARLRGDVVDGDAYIRFGPALCAAGAGALLARAFI